MAKSNAKRVAQFEKGAASLSKLKYTLNLYVTGMTPRSLRAIRNITKICEEHLKGRYELSVIDLYRQPEAVSAKHVVVAPTLIKSLPLPVKRLIGDMTNTDKIILSLDLRPKKR